MFLFHWAIYNEAIIIAFSFGQFLWWWFSCSISYFIISVPISLVYLMVDMENCSSPSYWFTFSSVLRLSWVSSVLMVCCHAFCRSLSWFYLEIVLKTSVVENEVRWSFSFSLLCLFSSFVLLLFIYDMLTLSFGLLILSLQSANGRRCKLS